MENLKLPPFRDDFVSGTARFGPPDFKNKERWNNRMVQNLLFYQTNYLVVMACFFTLFLYIKPMDTILGGALISGIFAFAVLVTQNRGALREVKKEHPVMMLVGVLSACLIGVYTLGSIAVFILSIALPLLIVLLHASFRMRNLKNKVQNQVEAIGLKKTPVGMLFTLMEQEY